MAPSLGVLWTLASCCDLSCIWTHALHVQDALRRASLLMTQCLATRRILGKVCWLLPAWLVSLAATLDGRVCAGFRSGDE